VRAAIEQGDIANFPTILEAIQTTGALEYTRECARHEADMAIAAIAALPDGIYREALVELCGFAVDRDH
jgi:octaprenyl-diphosphate synthase